MAFRKAGLKRSEGKGERKEGEEERRKGKGGRGEGRRVEGRWVTTTCNFTI